MLTSVLITVTALLGMTERCLSQVNLDQLLKFTYNNLLQPITKTEDVFLETHQTKHKLGEPVPRHLLDLECQASQWVEECKAGIILTYKDLNNEICNLFCQDEYNCNSFITDINGNCGLLSYSPGGTTKSIGLSGPMLPLKRPKSTKRRGRNRQRKEDCSEFHFNSCPEDLVSENRDNKFQIVEDGSSCKTLCDFNLLDEDKECRTFLYEDNFNTTQKHLKQCWTTPSKSVSSFLSQNCRVFFGRVATDNRFPMDFDNCMLHENEDADFKCVRGYCDLSSILYMEIEVESFKTERRCKLKCHTFPGCTHYEWHAYTKKCRLLQRKDSEGKPVQPYICKAAVGLKGEDIDKCTMVDCKWNQWKSWSECSVPCDQTHLTAGKRTRQRDKIVEAYPPGIGKECKGPNEETEECIAKHCGVCTNIKWTTTSHNSGYSWKFNLCEGADETSTTIVTTVTPTTPETTSVSANTDATTTTTPATTTAAHYVTTTECCQDPGTYYLNCLASDGNGWQGGYLQVGSSPTKICIDFNSGANKTVLVDFP